MWVTSGRFSLFDDTKSAEFSVMIRKLTVEDTGSYQCGVDKSWGNDIYTPVELKVKEDLSYEKSISKTVQVGEDLNISCKYPESLRSYNKFLCRRQSSVGCHKSVKASRKYVNVGKFSLYDDRTEQIFTVSIRNVTKTDSGEYWCGAGAAWTSDHGYKVYFTQINLTVTGSSGSREVNAYTGGEVNIKSRYEDEYKDKPKSICRIRTQQWCFTQTTKNLYTEWTHGGRFSVYDNRSAGFFNVFIRELIMEDTGTYLFTVAVSDEIKTYTVVNLIITEDLSYEKSISKTVQVGGDLNISCKYPESLRSYNKFLCRRQSSVGCHKISVKESKKDVNVGKFSLYDDRTEQIFTVSIRNVTKTDSGEYWCGAGAAWTSDHGYKVYFTQINLTVTGEFVETWRHTALTIVTLQRLCVKHRVSAHHNQH
ncbi:hypothetical protein HF521_001030 [Silurus meridionalis]|uniref:Ig-like domain-containing protein n=1 Tax=Silurus meridionalis TaxID=175797 RepID=A0A8T0BY58_SILME|nr:hypothetical protein HF521_001030 [Silurus meridionalis]